MWGIRLKIYVDNNPDNDSQSDASLSEVCVCLFVWSRVHKGDKETGLRVYNLTGVNNDNAPFFFL